MYLHSPEGSSQVLSETHSVRGHLLIKPLYQCLQSENEVLILNLHWEAANQLNSCGIDMF